MHVPVIVIDRIGKIDRVLIRTELRRQIISAYEIDDKVVAITGRLVAVRAFANLAAVVGVPRCRRLMVDGEEINQAHDEPGQFTDYTKQKISRFEGLDKTTAMKLWDGFKAHRIEAGTVENPDGTHSVLAEFAPICNDEVAELVEEVLTKCGYDFVGASRGKADGVISGRE